METKKNDEGNIKPDLKHDTMEFSAATDGDDVLNSDLGIEEDEITADELELIDNNDNDEMAESLNSVEIDREADDEIYFEEDSNDRNDDPADEEHEVRR